MVTLWDILAFALILSLNAFFCAAESALTAVSEPALQAMQRKGSRRARVALSLVARRPRVVAALLVGQNIVGAALAVYSTLVIDGALSDAGLPPGVAPALAVALSIVLLLVFGEVVPKSVAVSNATPLTLAFAYPIYAVTAAFRPITGVLATLSNAVLRLMGKNPNDTRTISVEEIQAIARMSGATGVIDEQESELIQKASQLNDIRVREIMIPRTDIVGIEVSMQLSRIRTLVQAGQYSRLPVYKGDLDDVVGILHFKEFLSYAPQKDQAFDLVGFLHKPLFVPESMFIGDLLKQMQARRTHIAVVLDEYGGTSGLITIEDVVEMLVGRIEDEYDAVSVPFEQVDETTWDVDGRVTDDALFEQLGLFLLAGTSTAAGLLILRLAYWYRKANG
jgi:putative hemolysin